MNPNTTMNHKISNGVNATKIALFAVVMSSFAPISATAQSVPDYQPFVFEIKNSENVKITLSSLGDIIFTDNGEVEGLSHEPIIDPRLAPLRAYLESKNSPMAPYAEHLLKQYHYRLIIGISFAESNFCKIQIRIRNCWGIGGTRPESYASYEEAITRANNLIQKYHDGGLTTPERMRTRWVGWKNTSWPIAVSQVTSKLESMGI